MTAVDAETSGLQPAAWELRYRAPRTLWVEVSVGRPERGIACTNRSGVYQIERWDVGTDRLEPITTVASGEVEGWLSPDGDWVVWHRDHDGNEFGHFVARRWSRGDPIDLTPDVADYASFAAGFSGDGWFAASIIRDDLAQILVFAPTEGGFANPTILDPGPGFVTSIAISVDPASDGSRRVAYGTTAGEGLSTRLRVIDARDGSLIDEVRQPPGAVRPHAFADDGRLLGSTTLSGVTRPLVLDPWRAVHEYELPELPGDALPLDLSPDGRQALLLGSDRSVQRLLVLDLETGSHRTIDAVGGTLDNGYSRPASRFAPDGTLIVTREDAGTPPEVVSVDPTTGELRRTLLAAPDAPTGRPFVSVDIPSSEGATVQGWLATPVGDGPFPTVLEVHGGPQANESDRFHPAGQAWVDRGFAFLTLNYRGSTGFGRDYEQAIWGRTGELELADVVAAREWLVGNGVARPEAIVITGGSYGGYLTLLALGRRPDLWAAGVAYVAIADWRLMHEDGVALREYQEALFGGTPDQTPALHVEASPITYVEQLAAPLLIIQGRNDPRCPSRQMEAYVEKARRLGKELEIDWFDAGHGHGGVETRIAWQRRAMEFVEQALAERSSAR
jgi:dipeptidyl aminopeptidase/acylaminoacyl peptidase